MNSHAVVNGVVGLPHGRAARGTSGLAPVATSRRVEPTGREVFFEENEIIVSKTDLRGRITYVNDVFCRLSGYSEAESIGMPHSFIRHVDMPRCVFKLLWDTVQSGRELFAYVVNATKSGDHYWVFANVTPTFDGQGTITGYHSNRRCPERLQVQRIAEIYRRLVEIERGYSSKADGVSAATQELERIIKQSHTTYEEFVFSI